MVAGGRVLPTELPDMRNYRWMEPLYDVLHQTGQHACNGVNMTVLESFCSFLVNGQISKLIPTMSSPCLYPPCTLYLPSTMSDTYSSRHFLPHHSEDSRSMTSIFLRRHDCLMSMRLRGQIISPAADVLPGASSIRAGRPVPIDRISGRRHSHRG